MIASISSRSHRRTSVATWSFLERAVCRRFPAPPARAVSRRSMFMCTSSASIDQEKRPLAISRAMVAKPRSIAARSAAVRMPTARNMRACASEPRMSCAASRLSNPTDAV